MSGSNQRLTEDLVKGALRSVIDPDLRRDIVSLGFVKDISIAGGKVAVTIELTTPACPVKDRLRNEAADSIRGIPGVTEVEVTMTAQVRRGQGGGLHGPGQAPQESPIPGVKNTIAVTSGKGGVGKSTVAANLAVALTQTGARVGLLDADVYGPSIPTMFGVPAEEKPYVNSRELIEPIERDGLLLMSIGFLVERDAAMIMRGPMLAKYVQDALAKVDWGELDYLVIDLPPGTGDVQLTLSQTIPLTGAVVVTTPQKVSLADVRRAVTMCEKLNVPILGIVENMSDPIAPNGTRIPMFGSGGGQTAAQEWGVPFLGEVTLDAAVPTTGDEGTPIVQAGPDSPA
ncbi:MAG: Mrp/NBP35 family ATP-binding protein, partial [Armatimonadetes bacterium]|nr:Mrp/NBP35 family ATP-binding protein [Armatimonadota bacterium]